MTRLTICPHYLTDYASANPQDIERHIITPLANCLSESLKRGVEIVVSNDIFNRFIDGYPWNRLAETKWRPYLHGWYSTIGSYIGKAEKICIDEGEGLDIDRCDHLQEETVHLFARFLAVFGRGEMHGGVHEESILCIETCNYTRKLASFFLIESPAELASVLHPWLRVYKKPLPPEGEFRFVPPSDWRNLRHPKRGGPQRTGYLDVKGNVWEWDRLHNDHWDVQLPEGGYYNVSCSGDIL